MQYLRRGTRRRETSSSAVRFFLLTSRLPVSSSSLSQTFYLHRHLPQKSQGATLWARKCARAYQLRFNQLKTYFSTNPKQASVHAVTYGRLFNFYPPAPPNTVTLVALAPSKHHLVVVFSESNTGKNCSDIYIRYASYRVYRILMLSNIQLITKLSERGIRTIREWDTAPYRHPNHPT